MSITSVSLPGAYGLDAGFTPDTTQRHVLGTRIDVLDSYWGYRRLVYAKNAAAAYKVGYVCVMDVDSVMTIAPVNTTGLNAPLYVCLHPMASGTYGWYIEAGMAPVYSYVTLAANAIPAIDAGHSGMIVTSASTHLPIHGMAVLANDDKQATATLIGTIGTTKLKLSTVDGFFVGGVISSTGITSAQTVTAIDEAKKEITLSATWDSAPSGTIAFNYDGTSNEFWQLCRFRYPHGATAVV